MDVEKDGLHKSSSPERRLRLKKSYKERYSCLYHIYIIFIDNVVWFKMTCILFQTKLYKNIFNIYVYIC